MSNYQDVLARVREYVRDPDNGAFDIWGPRRALSKKIPDSAYVRSGHLTATYCAQVLRAVNALVSEGALVKSGEGRDAMYWTPAALERYRAERARDKAAEAALAKRWGSVQARLAARGYGGILDSILDIRLPLEEWERLLDELETAGDNEQEGNRE